MVGIKCLVWDLDNTVWDGTCLEDATVELRPGIKDVLAGIRERGILQSIASKNEPQALQFVRKFELDEFFVHPFVNWEPKEENIREIAKLLNIGLDAVGFVDDNAFERDSVRSVLPEVRTYDAVEYTELLNRPEFAMKYDTPESRGRGQMYVEEAARKELEESYDGRKEVFLASLEMVATPRLADRSDVTRIRELVTRTNQFNSTGVRYSDDEIEEFFGRSDHEFHVCSLVDRHGDYGRCGVALIRDEPEAWNVEILLLSCRVAGRGLGTSFLSYLTEAAARAGKRVFRAKYIKTDRNRQIGLLYKIMGFEKDKGRSDESSSVFAYDLAQGPAPRPEYIAVELGEAAPEAGS